MLIGVVLLISWYLFCGLGEPRHEPTCRILSLVTFLPLVGGAVDPRAARRAGGGRAQRPLDRARGPR